MTKKKVGTNEKIEKALKNTLPSGKRRKKETTNQEESRKYSWTPCSINWDALGVIIISEKGEDTPYLLSSFLFNSITFRVFNIKRKKTYQIHIRPSGLATCECDWGAVNPRMSFREGVDGAKPCRHVAAIASLIRRERIMINSTTSFFPDCD